jgi:acyl-CoA-binding protein
MCKLYAHERQEAYKVMSKNHTPENKSMCELYAHERQAHKVMSRNHTPEDKSMCKLYAHERQAEKTSKPPFQNCHCTETEPKHRTPVDTKATHQCTMHEINACTPTQLMHV